MQFAFTRRLPLPVNSLDQYQAALSADKESPGDVTRHTRMKVHTFEIDLDGRKLSIETGKIAKQAGGSVVVRSGDSVVLVTATTAAKPKPNQSFFPLTCDYREYTYAAGIWRRHQA